MCSVEFHFELCWTGYYANKETKHKKAKQMVTRSRLCYFIVVYSVRCPLFCQQEQPSVENKTEKEQTESDKVPSFCFLLWCTEETRGFCESRNDMHERCKN